MVLAGSSANLLQANLPGTPAKRELLEAAEAAVVRVEGFDSRGTKQTWGTAVRLTEAGDYLTCTHVISEDGKFVEAYIDGHLLELTASYPYFDAAFVRGENEHDCQKKEEHCVAGAQMH